MKAILAFALTHRSIVVIGALVFLLGGLFAFSRLDIEAYPNPAPPILEITAQAAGLSAEEIEKYYTIPIEVGLYPTPDVQSIRSTSFYGLSFVRVTFKYGTDYYFAYQEAAIALTQNVNLPNNLVPSIQASSLTGEIYRYQVTGPPGFGLTNLRTVQDYLVLRRLSTVPGIVQINSFGGTTKAFDVDVDPKKLEAFGITVPQLLTAIGNANANVGGREIELGQQSINIRGVGLIDDGGNDDLTKGYKTEDIDNIALGQFNGVPVLVKNVAKVSVGYLPRLGIVGRDNEDDIVESIVVMGYKDHTNDVLPRLQAEVAKINTDGSLPPGVKVVPFYDRGRLVAVTTHTVLENLIVGVSLVFLVQWVFLGNLRAAIIIAFNIPFALLFAFIMITIRGEGANLLSVGAVDFGIFVDAAVILIENIFQNFALKSVHRQALLRQLSEGRWGADPTAAGTPGSKGWTKRLRLFFVSAVQVNAFIFFTQAITVAAFVPLFTMQGVEGQIFGPMARTYVYAMMGALLATFTVTPVLASLLLPVRIEEVETIAVRLVRAVYTPILRFSVDHYRIVIVVGVVILAAAGLAATRLGSEFLPALEEGNFYIRAALPPTMSLEAGTDLTRKMREILLRHPEVITVVSQHGRPDNGSDASPFSNVEMFVPLKPFDEWPAGLTKEKLTATVQKEFNNELPGIGFNFSQYIQDNIEEALSGVKGANSIKIIGPNIDLLEKYAAEVSEEINSVPGMADIGTFHVKGQPNLNIKVDRAKAARYGLNTGDINTIVQTAIGGTAATTVLEGDRQFNLLVRLEPQYRDTVEAIENVKVGYATGNGSNAYIPLSELATITLDTGASYIYREGSARYIPIKFSVRGRDLGSTVAEAQDRIARNVHLPTGYRIVFSGEFEDLQIAQKRLAIVLPITLFLILILLYSLFNDVRFTLLTLVGIPFLVANGIFALYLTGLDFSISAAIGFISLLGVAVMDGILNLAYFRELRNEGLAVADAVFRSAEQRMRPMLMTALSNGIGLIPAASSTGIGSQVQKPLATVIVGGMIVGPIMLLIIAPAVRMMFLRHEDRDGAPGAGPTRQNPPMPDQPDPSTTAASCDA